MGGTDEAYDVFRQDLPFRDPYPTRTCRSTFDVIKGR